MPIYEFAKDSINRIAETTFSQVGMHERRDLQRLLRESVDVVASGTLVIAEEFGEWDESRRRIDLLGIDREANLVVIELKRTEDGGHMELQSIRYAAMVSTMTFDRAVDVYGRYLAQVGKGDRDPRTSILEFLEWSEPDEDQFAQDVRIILVSAEFSKELTSSVLWLISYGIDISCVRLKPYGLEGRLLVDVQQVIPLPEAAEYQVKVREKVLKERQARTSGADFTRFNIEIDGAQYQSQWKRNGIFLICKYLCGVGISPEQISNLFAFPNSRVWYWVDGIVTAIEFEKLGREKEGRGGPRFDRSKWFCGADELIQADGKTYAFSNQWGGDSWHKAMKLLKKEYANFRIEFTPAS